MTELLTREVCTLCSLPLPSNSLIEDDKHFCCHGCQAVFNILSSRGELDAYEASPLFQQAVETGLISNPQLLDELRERKRLEGKDELEKLHFEVEMMWCPSCAEVIRLVLLQETGIESCIVDYATDLGVVTFSPRHISKENIFNIMKKLSYNAVPLEDAAKRKVSLGLYLRFGLSAFCSLNIMMFSYPIYASYFSTDDSGMSHLFAWLSFFTALPVVLFCGWPIFRRCATSLSLGILGMETLVTMSVASAFALSSYELWHGGVHVYFDSMTVIITLVLLGKIIETRAKFSAKDSLLRLNRAIPRRGKKRFSDGENRYVSIKEIDVGDTLIVAPGEKLVLDGKVIEGEGSCDESLMTGESIPVTKCFGSRVTGGTLLKNGWLAYEVTATVEASALQRIIEMVEHDIGNKTAYIPAVEVIIRSFVPIICLLAFLSASAVWWMTGDGNLATIRGMTVLLISCPCAVGIAAPLAEAQLINALAKLGAIVRNRGSLRLLPKVDNVVFDKTGTITEGCFTVKEGCESLDFEKQRVLKTLASQSMHPISAAIANNLLVPALELSEITEVIGKGVMGSFAGERYFLGSRSFLEGYGISPLSHPVKDDVITTKVYFANEEQCLSEIHLGDSLRSDAIETIQSLQPKDCILLSGDGPAAVEAVAHACQFKKIRSEQSPLDKSVFIHELKKEDKVVCMIGDGVNDAPSITAADVGISVMTATDMSIQVSDILLATEKLKVLPKIFELSSKGQRIIKQNLFWAFFYNVLGIPLAMTGYLSPLFAAFAMVCSSLFVVFNAMRSHIYVKD
jgi:heavy metal translocating P-type ATPase